EIMSEAGVAGATTARIAADVGVSEPALYRHFKNKQGMLLAALDDISARLIVHTVSAAEGEDDVVMQLRLMSAAFYDFVMSNPEETRVLFEVVSAVRGADMRTAVRERFAQLLAVIEAVLIDGVDRGALREDLDVSLAAWEILSLGVTLYFASTLGLEDVLTKEKALTAVERLLESIETKPKERSGKQ
ncbi:MAG TPA: TetR family transcriptional regulator, partial [Candidatus Anoxymicrobiaceae bacterium]